MICPPKCLTFLGAYHTRLLFLFPVLCHFRQGTAVLNGFFVFVRRRGGCVSARMRWHIDYILFFVYIL